eukprot:Skav229574  [mRNA]  locus=scaffold568:729085:734774:+ [translate_table: standard]
MEESRQKSYAEVANVLYGSRAGILVDVTIALYNFGVLVCDDAVQVMIIGDIVPSFLNFLNAPEILQDRTLVLVLSGLLVLFPLSSMPSTSTADCQRGVATGGMGALRHASLLCILMIALLSAALLVVGTKTIDVSKPLDGPVQYSLLHPDDGSYRRFEACSPVVDKEDQSPESPSVFATPFRMPGEDYLKEPDFVRENGHGDRMAPPAPSTFARLSWVVLLVCSTVLLGIQAQGIILPDLSVVFGLTGGFCGGLVTFAFPAMFYIRVARKKGERRLNLALACFNAKKVDSGLFLGAWAGHVLLWFGLLAGVGSSALVAVTAWDSPNTS